MTTGATAHLQLLRQEGGMSAEESSLTSYAGIAPDDGRRTHPATSGKRSLRSRQQSENELVGFVCDLVRAPETAVGTVSAGVLEAALLVVSAARDARPLLRRPTVVVAQSVHPAYLVAAHALGVTPVVVPVDGDGRAPIGPMTAAVSDETVLMIVSAPSFTHGVVDPVAWLAAAALATEVPLHVEASRGGWALAFAELDGRIGPAWGFAVPGVRSMTLDVGPDTGQAADLSVTLHRCATDRSRAAGAVALGWHPDGGVLAETAETLREIGLDGCAQLARRSLDAAASLVEGLLDLHGVDVVARPDSTSVTLRADTTCDVFTLADELSLRGWAAEPLLSIDGRPPLLRFQVTAAMEPVVPACVDSFAAAVRAAQERGPAVLDPTLAATIGRLHPEDDAAHLATGLVEAAGVLDAAMPTGPASALMTHLLLDVAAGATREALLVARHDLRSRPARGAQPATSASIVDSE